MKKQFAFLFALAFVLSTSVFAQTVTPTVTIGSNTGTSPVNVMVTLDCGIHNIGAFDLTVSYDHTLITNVEFVAGSISFTDLPVISYPATGRFRVNWANPSNQSLSGTGNFYLRFTGNAIGTSALTFYTPNTSNVTELIQHSTTNQVTSNFVDGSVTFDALPIPIKTWAIYLGMGMMLIFGVFRFIRIR